MDYIIIIISLLAGIAIGYLFARLRNNASAPNPALLQESERIRQDLKDEINTLRQQKEEQIRLHSAANQQAENLKERLAEQEASMVRLREEMQREFQNLANRIFEEKSEKFAAQNKNQIDILLNPLKDRLQQFQAKVEEVYQTENVQRARITDRLDKLAELSKQLSDDAINLTTALKGDNKMQGNWGELILEKILERSGLEEGREYFTQRKFMSADDKEIKPDVLVVLPENKHIIIDSKVSLVAYEAYISASTDEERSKQQKSHADSVRSHIRLLSEKKYETAQGLNTPDFVLLFMPIEAAFSLAMQEDPNLFTTAWDKHIVITSPTTLLATLRTVASIWTQEKRTRNAEQIATEAGKLYEKFAGFTQNMIDLGRRLDNAKDEYTEAMKKLSEGPGNLVRKTELLKKMGANTKKEINPKLVERAMEDSAEGQDE
ncbi:MAG: hypothetical protein RL220_1541 [Bacteroidota bacterium]|jgi:DNA recombination protein RmuC